MIIQNLIIGKDSYGVDLKCGDICSYEIYGVTRVGMIIYSETIYSFMFQQLNDMFPAIPMNLVEIHSIEKIMSFSGDKIKKNIPMRKMWKAIYNTNLYSVK